MAEPIKLGDLVAVIRWPCCGKLLGLHGTVDGIYPSSMFDGSCVFCRARFALPSDIAVLGKNTAPLKWLKRIPPLSELDDVKQDEEITA